LIGGHEGDAGLAVLFADRVRCTTATVGTGTISLSTATAGYQTFAQAVATGQLTSGCSVYYVIQDGLNWECGAGVYTAGSPDTLTRGAVSSSSGLTAIALSGSAQVAITLTTQFANAAMAAAPLANPVLTGGVTLTSGTLNLSNATANVISFPYSAMALGPPTFTTSSVGTRLILWANAGGSTTDFAIGVDQNTLWFDVNQPTAQFQWFAGTASIVTLSGTGSLYTIGGVSGVIGPNIGVTGTFTALQALTPTAGDNSTNIATTRFVAPLMANTGRNRLHNGRMQVTQRGTSFTFGAAAGNYTADRWSVSGAVASNVAVNGTTAFGSAPNYLAVTGTFTAIGQNLYLFQRLEAADSMDLAGQTVTVSFYASGTVATGTYSAFFYVQYPPSADSWTSGTNSATVSVPLTGSVSRLQGSVGIPAGATTGLELCIVMQLVSGTGGATTFNISNIQMEVGTKASVPETRELSHEVINCERYYRQIQVSARQYFSVAGYFYESNVTFGAMRVVPTSSFVSSGGALNVTITSGNLVPVTNTSGRFFLTPNATGDCYAFGQTFALSADL